jgi:hypothetical protein
MIIYNVEQRFFAEKLPAEKYRKELKLKPDALKKLEVKDRWELSGLLDTVLYGGPAGGSMADGERVGKAHDKYVSQMDGYRPPEYPQFVLDDWDKRRKMFRKED